jgi:hypothetical protein
MSSTARTQIVLQSGPVLPIRRTSTPMIGSNAISASDSSIPAAAARRQYQAEAVAAVASAATLADGALPAFLASLTQIAARVVRASRVSIWLFEDDGRRLVSADTYQHQADRHSRGETLAQREFADELIHLRTG